MHRHRPGIVYIFFWYLKRIVIDLKPVVGRYGNVAGTGKGCDGNVHDHHYEYRDSKYFLKYIRHFFYVGWVKRSEPINIFSSCKNTHYSKFISLIVSGSLLPQSLSYKPRLTAFPKELWGQSHGLA